MPVRTCGRCRCLSNKYSTNYTLAFAAFLLSSLPILVFYLLAQKQIINGLTTGAVKS